MKKVLFNLMFLLLLTGGLSAQIIVSGDITSNTNWTNNNIYLLNGWVYVKSGATLTIQPGTIIKGDFNTKGALIIERGAKIIADGTPQQPIVFTSQKAPGQRGYGDWGGLIICGRASVNTPANAGSGTAAGEAIVEGGVGSVYGGGATPNDNDDSGILRYVRIEFGGIPFQPNSEINGLTLGGVGRGTIIENIQVSYSGDDAYEWFGGTVNCKNLVAYKNWDDDFDTDFGYRGNIQFGLVVRDPNIADQSGSNAFESDNDGQGTTNTPITRPVFSNITVIGPYTFASSINSNYKRALHLRRNTQTSVFNSVFANYPVGLLVDGSSTHNNAMNNDMRFKNSVICGMNDSLATTTNADPNNISGAFNISTWFNNAANSNSLVNSMATLGFHNASLQSPDLTLNAGSPLLSGASFTDSYLNNSFFTSTDYRGAFGTQNWASCWTEWDPQNADYNSAVNYTVTSSISVVGNSTVCPGTAVSVSAETNVANPIISWNNGTTTSETEYPAPASVTLNVSSPRGCAATTQNLQLNVHAAPSVSISADGPTSFCTGGSVVLTSSQNSGNVWSNDATTSTLTVSESGSYSLVYTDANGCEATSNIINVSVSNSPVPTITAAGSTQICDGASVVLSASTSDSYVWSLNGEVLQNETGSTINATETGAYTVTVTNDNACDGVGTSSFVFVQVNPQPEASFDYDFDFGSYVYNFNNNSINASSYQWNFGDGQTSTLSNPVVTFTTPGSHTVTLTAISGQCTDVFTFTIGSVNVEESEIAGNVVLFPNPTAGDVTLRFDVNNSADVAFEVIDLTGKIVFSQSGIRVVNTASLEIPSSEFAAGMYFVRYTINDQSEVIRMVVKK